jgi:monofunctional biosynthetic peptidoglycan transglycosylase
MARPSKNIKKRHWGWWTKWAKLTCLALLVAPFFMAMAYIWLPVPATPLMLWRWVNGVGVDKNTWFWERDWVALNRLPGIIPQAVIASEDNNFCTHGGVDWLAVQQVYEEWQAGEGLRGASTVSMQVARNVFLWPNQDYVRKALEVPFTYLIEHLWGKRRIMEVYLNIAEWGPGVYGIEAAAKHHYGKSARRLNRQEIFRLVSILPSPLRWNPKANSRWGNARAASLGRRVAQLEGSFGCLKVTQSK